MRELEIAGLYDSVEEEKISDFTEQMDSRMRVKTDYYKDDNNLEWLDVFEELLPYVEKIVNNPKRFIVSEEEIVKVEAAKKIGVETVKHLAKHTNFIQDIDKDTGDVIPAKLLNVFKEETFDTYENRFIYTLIQYMLDFIRIKKENLIRDPKLKDNKKVEYTSSTMVGAERINVNIKLDTALDTKLDFDPKFDERVKKLEDNIKGMQYTEVYMELENAGVPLVTEPIRKTNVILKNVNFQYAMQLWTYIRQHTGKNNEPKKINKDYMEKGNLKKLIDETFLLEYLTINNINNDEKFTQMTREKTLTKMLDRIIEMNPELTKKELQDKLGVEFEKAKERRKLTKSDIEKIFRKHIDKYLERVK